MIDGWTVRHVSRGVAIIQGRRMGAIEVEAGDVVPGVGRIESIRRQDGRWIVLTSNGMITVADAALDATVANITDARCPGLRPGIVFARQLIANDALLRRLCVAE